jgi:hypothetical protein
MKRFIKATKIEEERNTVAVNMQREIRHSLNAQRGARSNDRKSLQHAQAEREKRVQRQSTRVEREVCSKPYRNMVQTFEEVFSKNLRAFMVLLTNSDSSQTHQANLCVRLDCNGYIANSLGLT